MVLNVDGINLTPLQSGYTPDRTIIRPEYGGAGLLNDGSGAEYDNLINNFAGGLLNGYQVIDNQVVPINPSGVFMGSGDPNDPNMGGDEGGGDGAFSITDLMELQSSLSQANFGNQDVGSVFSSFVDAGGGTFNIDPKMGGSYVVASSLFGTDANGNRVPMNQAEYKYGDRRGTPISKQYAMNVMKAALSGIDESGGSDGSQGDSEGDSAQ